MSEPAAPARAPEPDSGGDSPYRVAFENGHEVILIAQDGVIKVANQAAERVSGFSRQELLGKPFLDLIHADDQAQTVNRYQRRLAGDRSEQSMTARIVRKDGAVAWVESHSMPVQWEGRAAVLVFVADVTERELARREALERDRMLERIAELTPHFIFIYDYEIDRDVYLNRSVPAGLGYSPQQEAALQPYPFAKLCHPEDLARAMDRDRRWEDAPDGTVDTVEFRLLHASGEWRWFRSLNTPFLRDAKGRVRQILGVSEDVTERRKSEEAVRRTEKLESLAVLAGGLAHDFGNLLTPVLGRAELLLSRLSADSPLRVHAEAIRTAAERSAELVEQLVAYAGRRPAESRPVDVGALAAEVVELLRPVIPSGVRAEMVLQPGLAPAAGDPSQLRQVVLNLLTNAFEAAGDRGRRVVLRTRAGNLAEEDLAGLDLADGIVPGPVLVLEVEDDGEGMDAATRARLWEPFFTTKPRGRGLGLPSVLGILRRHGAGLAVDSEPGVGTTFRVYLPLAHPSAPARAATAGREL